jgi:hypothetical protein
MVAFSGEGSDFSRNELMKEPESGPYRETELFLYIFLMRARGGK